MEFDYVVKNVGEFGRIQLIMTIFFGLTTASVALQMIVTVFMQQTPEHRCAIPSLANDTFEIQGPWHQCLINQTIPVDENGEYEGCLWRSGNYSKNESVWPCKDWVYDTAVFPRTFPTEFDLLCDSSLLINMANVVYLVGVAVGAAGGGLVADYTGRKLVSFIACFIHGIAGIGAAFSPNYGAYVAFRCFVGICHGVLNNTVIVLCMEFVSPRKRIISLCTAAFSWGTGILLGTLEAYLIRDWRYLQLAVALPSVLYLLFWWITPESPRWLISRGKYAEAESVMRWVAKVNNTSLPEGRLFDDHSLRSTPTISPRQLRNAPRLIARTVVISFGWLTVGVSWYGLTLNQGSLDGDIFINAFVLALIDFISAFALLIINRIGRKTTYCVAMMLSALAMLSTILMHFFANKESSATSATFTALYTIGKLGVSCCYTLLFMWNGEFYPTALRNFGLGIGYAFGSLGAVISPIVMV
ncbi:organic cation transporter protein-like [Lingula anatina]|uniref:Organic cation transporter protein-like n=1 Tax=Lingula anatina TaxID=7574 RepID=A0A1S3HKH5_LINAN|nr:organic cation transporter protein-like [Lingula anatina]|eukprot:XP_013385966.1 organic cation transporter protein-like [Lingula anatina]